jgi:predicted ATPase
MAKIVGFTGAHGVGKSTILSAIAQRHLPHIRVDTFSVSRSVQQDFYPGLALSYITSDPNNVPAFQDRILERMHQRVQHLSVNQEGVVLVDRTPIDCLSYARLWVRQAKSLPNITVDLDTWLGQYTMRCVKAMSSYSFVFIVPPRNFAFAPQQDRASEATQRQHHEYIKDFFRTFAHPHKVVRPLALDSRVDYCLQHLERLALK